MANLEQMVSIAAEAFNAVFLELFDRWKLIPARRDVAILIIAGFP